MLRRTVVNMEESSLGEFLNLSHPSQHFHLTQQVPVSPGVPKCRSAQRYPRPAPQSSVAPEPFYLYENHPQKVVFPLSQTYSPAKKRSMTHKAIRKTIPTDGKLETIENYKAKKPANVNLIETERYRHSLM